MIHRKMLAVVALVCALVVPASALGWTPYNYFSAGVYPGAPSPAATDGHHDRMFNNLFFTSGDYYNGTLTYITNKCGDRGGNSNNSPYSIDASCNNVNSYVSCQRNTTGNPFSGGTGYRSSFICRTNTP